MNTKQAGKSASSQPTPAKAPAAKAPVAPASSGARAPSMPSGTPANKSAPANKTAPAAPKNRSK